MVVNKQIQINTLSDNVFKGNTKENKFKKEKKKIPTGNFEVIVCYYNNTRFLNYI